MGSGNHCLIKRLLNILADDFICNWRLKGLNSISFICLFVVESKLLPRGALNDLLQ